MSNPSSALAHLTWAEGSLSSAIRSLPQEFQDLIAGFAFGEDYAAHTIDADYKPSALLQVNRTLRDKYAMTYYSEPEGFGSAELKLLVQWYASVAPPYQVLIAIMRVRSRALGTYPNAPLKMPTSFDLASAVRLWLTIHNRETLQQYPEFPMGKVEIEILTLDERGAEKWVVPRDVGWAILA